MVVGSVISIPVLIGNAILCHFNVVFSREARSFALDIESGIQAEERLIKFFQSSKFKNSTIPLCYVAVVGTRVHGIAARLNGTSNNWDVYACVNKKQIEEKFRQEIDKSNASTKR